MARIVNYEILQVWHHKTAVNVRYHVTNKGHILRTTGPRLGGAKFVMNGNLRRMIQDFQKFLDTNAERVR